MTPKDLIMTIKLRFDKALETKTGWGKNEVKTLLDQIIIEVLSENIKESEF